VKVIEQLEKRVPRGAQRLRFGVFHVACPESVAEAAAELKARWGEREVLSAPGTPVIATHAGEGAWGVAWMVED
jgi:fatty acid-binding protein DegV